MQLNYYKILQELGANQAVDHHCDRILSNVTEDRGHAQVLLSTNLRFVDGYIRHIHLKRVVGSFLCFPLSQEV